MRKTIINMVFLVIIFTMSCEKTSKDKDVNTRVLESELYLNESISDLMLCSQDIELQDFNAALINKSYGLATSLSEKTLRQDVLINSFNELRTISLSNVLPSSTLNKTVENVLTYKGFNYDIGIRYFNKDYSDPEKEAIVCV
ncbi:MAG: hypothetical protein PF450_00240, partial [Bacteroidales bacterium]|nr:hypothetical protein [Bacteroidales bacterium]